MKYTSIIIILGILVIVFFGMFFKVIKEYERGVVFRFGKIGPVREPGLVIIIPFVEKLTRVDLRVITLSIPPQDVITKDNVSARVSAVVMFQIFDPIKAILEVENYAIATSQISQTTLRSVLGRVELDTLLAHREGLNKELQSAIEKQAHRWGIDVSVVEIKDVEIPEVMQRAMAREAEAERERRAKIINARGELQASQELRQASDVLSQSPASLQLRYLQTLLELGADHNSTIVFPLPVDILGAFINQIPSSAHTSAKGSKASSAGETINTAYNADEPTVLTEDSESDDNDEPEVIGADNPDSELASNVNLENPTTSRDGVSNTTDDQEKNPAPRKSAPQKRVPRSTKTS